MLNLRMTAGMQLRHVNNFLAFQDIPAGQIHEFQVHRPGLKPLLYELKLGDEVMQAPMVNVCCVLCMSI